MNKLPWSIGLCDHATFVTGQDLHNPAFWSKDIAQPEIDTLQVNMKQINAKTSQGLRNCPTGKEGLY